MRNTSQPSEHAPTHAEQLASLEQYLNSKVGSIEACQQTESAAIIRTLLSMIRRKVFSTVEDATTYLHQTKETPIVRKVMVGFPGWLRHKGHDYVPKK